MSFRPQKLPADASANAALQSEPALDELLQRAYRFALSLTHDAAAAEDLVQDAWLAVLRAGGPWTRRFVFSVVRNRFIDQVRRTRLVSMESLDDRTDVDVDAERRFWSEESVPPVHGADLEQALARLRSEEREALFLSAVEGYTAREIAELWSCPRGTVLSMIHRARRKLRQWLSSDAQEAEGT